MHIFTWAPNNALESVVSPSLGDSVTPLSTMATRATNCNTFYLTVHVNREEGWHIDLDDFLMGVLLLAGELVRFFVFC